MDSVQNRVAIPAADPPDNANVQTLLALALRPKRFFADISHVSFYSAI